MCVCVIQDALYEYLVQEDNVVKEINFQDKTKL
jgi:hypothetical protein